MSEALLKRREDWLQQRRNNLMPNEDIVDAFIVRIASPAAHMRPPTLCSEALSLVGRQRTVVTMPKTANRQRRTQIAGRRPLSKSMAYNR